MSPNRLFRPCALALAAAALFPRLAAAAPGDPLGDEFPVNTYITDSQTMPAVAVDGQGNFVVVWVGASGASDFGVNGQRFSAAGAKIGAAFHVNSANNDVKLNPSIAMNPDGEFVVAWERALDDSGNAIDVYAQRFGAAATPASPEILVNSFTTGIQGNPRAGIDDDGNFVVAWSGSGPSKKTGCYFRTFTSDGTGVLSGLSTDGGAGPGLAVAGNGDFVVACAHASDDPQRDGIIVRWFSRDGGSFNTGVVADSDHAGFQFRPTIAADRHGGYVVAWSSDAGTGQGLVRARRLDHHGNPVGTEIALNDPTTDQNEELRIATDADGDAMVAWHVTGGSGYDGPILGRRFDFAGVPQGTVTMLAPVDGASHFHPALAAKAEGDFIGVWTELDPQGADGFGIRARFFEGAGVGFDYGDAPDPYPTRLEDDGARHRIDLSGPRLGALIDRDPDGAPATNARGDDASGVDDEDGVQFGPLNPGQPSNLTVTVPDGSRGTVDAWVDFNRDGDWNDAGEHIADQAFVGSGDTVLPFTVPGEAHGGLSYARVRITSAGIADPEGEAPNGEVEDAQVRIGGTPFVPRVRFRRVASTHQEGTTAGIVILLSAPVNVPVTVPLIYSGTATAGLDYLAPPASVVIPAGAGSALIDLETVNDREAEPAESIVVEMGKPTNARRAGRATTHTVTLPAND